MAKTYRKHRYHGYKFVLRQASRRLVSFSRPLAFALTAIYLLLPWLFPLANSARIALTLIAILSALGAFMWQRRAIKVGNAMDIIAAGHDGEGAVARVLAKLPREWAVLNDLALRAGGPIVQIDHIVITPAGVHVLETKAQKGQITATPQRGKWQVKRRGELRSIVNPVEQNRAQVEACKYLLETIGLKIPCHGLVVMTEATTQTNWPITELAELSGYLEQHTRRNKIIITPAKARELAKALLNFQVQGRAPWQKGPQHRRAFALTVLLPLFLYIIVFAGAIFLKIG